MRAHLPAIIGCTLLLLTPACTGRCATLDTGDGLSIGLSDATGAIERVSVDGRELPLAADGGGLSWREFTAPDPDAAQTALLLDFEDEEPSWTSAAMADWESVEVFAERRTDDPGAGQGYLRIGNGSQAGSGMAAAQPVPLRPGSVCTISWLGRSHDTAGTLILCLRLFDDRGNDVTAQVSPPRGWAHTPYSNAHYRVDFASTEPDTWQRFSYDYLTPEGVASALLSLRVYTGGALQTDIDDLRVAVSPEGWSERRPVSGPVAESQGKLVQRADAGGGLSFEAHWQSRPGVIMVTVAALSDTPRCLEMAYRLPLALEGWTWEDGPGVSAALPAGGRADSRSPMSTYPLACVHDGTSAVAMCAPLDEPALQTFRAEGSGLSTVTEMGLSPQAPHARTSFTLGIYRHDPAWGFRSALERYYDLFPGLFEVRTRRLGGWTLRLPAEATPAVEDFGLAFYECGGIGEDLQRRAREHDIAMLRYSEPWGLRQTHPEAQSRTDLPPYEQRLEQLRGWAAELNPEDRWYGGPRAEIAQALLNSLMPGPDGKPACLEDFYTNWASWWQLNTNPDLPTPNRASTELQYVIRPALEWADGIYLDSVSTWHCVYEDHDPAHLRPANSPLGFSVKTGRPVVISGMAHYEFIEALRHELGERDKLLMMNLHPPATRWFGHMADIAGCELLGLQDDVQAMQQRIYARHRPVSNLLQWRSAVLTRVPAMTSDELRAYFDNQLLYGFVPGISTAGGGTQEGYRYMHRYFEDPELLERDRELWRGYLPVFMDLNRAGWEPVTRARSDNENLRIERFGGGPVVHLTVHNPTGEVASATIRLEKQWWSQVVGESIEAVGAIGVQGPLRLEEDPDGPSCRLDLEPGRTCVIRFAPETAPAH